MSHEDPAAQQDNQWFPTDNAGANQDCSSNEGDCVVFRYKPTVGSPYIDMTMSALFPASVTIGDPDAFPPHLYAFWESDKRLGQLVSDAAYIVPSAGK